MLTKVLFERVHAVLFPGVLDSKANILYAGITLLKTVVAKKREILMDKATYQRTIKQHLQTAYLLSEDKAATMIPVFVNTLRIHVNQLAELADLGDITQLGRASHTVKGALLNMGLADLAEAAHALETWAKSGGCGDLDYRAMITELQNTVSQLGEDC